MPKDELKRGWEVEFSSAASKQKKKLPKTISIILLDLIEELEIYGPIQVEWPNFSSLKKDKRIPENAYHCHVKKGKPTYVACWRVIDKKIKILEIFYVGTHENAPY